MSKRVLSPGSKWARSVLLLLLAPVAAQADLRIEESGTTLEATVSRWIMIRGGRRAIVTRAEPKGVLFNAGAHYGATVEIARPDRDLLWQLDPQERSYREISAAEFTQLLQKGVQAPRNPGEQALRSLYKTETTQIEVVPTGKTRRVAGYDTEQVLARVLVGVVRPDNGNRYNYTFDQEVWLTRDETILKEVRPFEQAYIEAFGTALTLQQASVAASSWGDAFILPIRSLNDRVRALGGFPLAVSTTVTEEAVAQGKGEKSTTRKLSVASTEVRRIQLSTLPESEFELPAGFINSDTKVAVAPRPGTEPVPAPEPAAPAPAAPAGPRPLLSAVGPNGLPMPPNPLKATVPGGQSVAEKPRAALPPTPDLEPQPTPAPSATPAPRPSPAVVARPAETPQPTPAAVPPGPRTARTRSGATPVIVESYTAPPVLNNIPVLLSGGIARTQAPPPPVTVDEPETAREKKSRKRR